jgi:hypothetical protein
MSALGQVSRAESLVNFRAATSGSVSVYQKQSDDLMWKKRTSGHKEAVPKRLYLRYVRLAMQILNTHNVSDVRTTEKLKIRFNIYAVTSPKVKQPRT